VGPLSFVFFSAIRDGCVRSSILGCVAGVELVAELLSCAASVEVAVLNLKRCQIRVTFTSSEHQMCRFPLLFLTYRYRKGRYCTVTAFRSTQFVEIWGSFIKCTVARYKLFKRFGTMHAMFSNFLLDCCKIEFVQW
jgi:hypothetical protein